MSTKPTTQPGWASNSISEQKTIDGITVELPNKRSIPSQFQQTGIKAQEPLPRQYINQILDELCAWAIHLDERDEVGLTVMYPTGVKTATQVGNTRGGTWAQRGTLTDSLSNVFDIFEKTA